MSGQILLDGEDITDLSISERAKKGIGYGFQQPARFKGMKVKKLLDIAAGKKLPMLACNEYLAKVGLCSASYLTREVDKNLSGGEVKRIEIATILARDPKLAIYDEPEAGIRPVELRPPDRDVPRHPRGARRPLHRGSSRTRSASSSWPTRSCFCATARLPRRARPRSSCRSWASWRRASPAAS